MRCSRRPSRAARTLAPPQQFLPRLVDVELVVRGERFEHRVVEMIAPIPAADRAGSERKVRMRHHALRIEEFDAPRPSHLRAGAHRVVEGKQPRLELGERVVALRAGELRRKQVLLAVTPLSTTMARPSACRSAVSNDSARRCFTSARTLQPVDDHLDRVLDVALQARRGVQIVHLAVDRARA